MEISPRLQLFAEYFVKADPYAVNKLAYKHGYIPASSLEGMQGFLYEFLLSHGDAGFKELMSMHPDKEAVLAADGSPQPEPLSALSAPAPESKSLRLTKNTDSTHAVLLVGIIIIWFLIIKN